MAYEDAYTQTLRQVDEQIKLMKESMEVFRVDLKKQQDEMLERFQQQVSQFLKAEEAWANEISEEGGERQQSEKKLQSEQIESKEPEGVQISLRTSMAREEDITEPTKELWSKARLTPISENLKFINITISKQENSQEYKQDGKRCYYEDKWFPSHHCQDKALNLVEIEGEKFWYMNSSFLTLILEVKDLMRRRYCHDPAQLCKIETNSIQL